MMKRIAKISILIVLIVCIGLPIAFRVAASLRASDAVADLLPAEGRVVATNSGNIFLQEFGPADDLAPFLLLPPLLGQPAGGRPKGLMTYDWRGLWSASRPASNRNIQSNQLDWVASLWIS